MEKEKGYSKQAIGKIIDILIKINNSTIEEVAQRLGLLNTQVLNYVKGVKEPKKKHISMICKMFDIEEDVFYYFVSYYDSINIYEDIVRFKLTISYILELTFNNKELKQKNKFPFLDEEEPETEKGNYEAFVSTGENLKYKPF